jgi:hypothetical protein
LKIIYGDEEDNIENENFSIFTKLYKLGELRHHYEKGYLLAHHIVSSTNKNLLKYIILNYMNELSTYLTKPYIYNNVGFVICQSGTQSLLHVSAQNNEDNYLVLEKYIEDSFDSIGISAKSYLMNKNKESFVSRINKIIQDKYQVKIDTDKIIKDTYVNDELKNIFIGLLNNKTKVAPNSMHKAGIVLDRDNIYIRQFIDDLNLKYELELHDKIFNIYAFTAEYSPDTNNNLNIHKDDSIITINWNLELSDDIEGTELIIPSQNLLITPKKDQLLIHHGKIEHQVKERVRGMRKNLIVWLK